MKSRRCFGYESVPRLLWIDSRIPVPWKPYFKIHLFKSGRNLINEFIYVIIKRLVWYPCSFPVGELSKKLLFTESVLIILYVMHNLIQTSNW